MTEGQQPSKDAREGELLRLLVENVKDYAIFVIDPQGDVRSWNPGAERLLGYREDEIIGQSATVFFTPEDADSGVPGQEMKESVEEGRGNDDRWHVRKDGSRFWAGGMMTPLWDEDHRLLGFAKIMRDRTEWKLADLARLESESRQATVIRERQLAEAKAREQEQRALTILESITDGFWSVDRNWTFVYVNGKAEELLGRSRESLLGRNLWQEYAPAVGTEFEHRFHQAMDENRAIAFEAYYPPHDRWYELQTYPSAEGLSVYFRDASPRRQAEAGLRESEEKLRLLADTIPQLAWMARPDGHIFWYNRRWYEYTGTGPRQMEGWGWQCVHDPATLPLVLERWQVSIATGEPFDMVFPLRNADGAFRSFLTRVNPFRNDEGQVLYWFGTNTDIEDQRQAQEAQAQSEERFRQLADAMPQIVWTASPDGKIDYLNRRWHEFTGGSSEQSNQAWEQIVHPDDAPMAKQRWASSVLSGDRFEMEVRLLDRPKQVYRWHLVRTIAVSDGSGQVLRWFGTSTDIDEQKRSEESAHYLAEASAVLARVVDYESTLRKVANLAVPHFADWSAVDVANGDGSLRRLAVAHLDPNKISTVHELMQLYPPEPQSPGGALAVLRTGQPEMICEITDDLLVRGARDKRHLDMIRSLGLKSYICVPLIVSGDTIGVLTFATAESGRRYNERDLADAMDLARRASIAIENTRLYDALREADARKDEFLATLAHELRNPLAPIRSSIEILKMPGVDSEMVERSREIMERQVHHLARLVDDLLDVSRVMRGKIELRREPVPLATIVARAIETTQPLFDVLGHQLSVDIPPEILSVNADPVRLAQVIGNLLTNAAKYTPPRGRVWLTAERVVDRVELCIRDNGIGIAPEMLSQIFELFVQVDQASTKAQGGLGIGLTLVKNLVELHDGTVEARSPGPGQGSEFVVRLPLSTQTHAKERGIDAVAAAQPTWSSGIRLLVVDDNRDAASSLSMLLTLQGHQVRVANSGAAALALLDGYVPDAVFLDIGMPAMDGYEVARRMRERPGLENVVLAALTGWGQKEDRRRTAEAGFDYHLVKPPEPKAIDAILTDLRKQPL